VRRRILIAIVGVTALVVLMLGIPLGIAVRSRDRDEEVLRLERMAASATTRADAVHGAGAIDIRLRDLDGVDLAVYNPTGTRLRGNGPLQADAVVRLALTGKARNMSHNGQLIVAVPVAQHQEVVGAVRAAQPASVAEDRTHRTWLFMGLAGLGAELVALVLGAALARRLGRPVEALAVAASELGDGDFTSRAPRSGIEELDAVASALDASAARLGDALARERSFSADASHQLRTPLTALRAQLEAAELGSVSPESAIHDALQQADRLESTISDLLALARDAHVDRAPLDIATLVSDAERSWRPRVASTGRRLTISIGAELPTIRASRAATREILDVLIDNARAHGAGTIEVRARRAASGVAIEVEDHGPGFADGIHPFERRNGRQNGHGIGLALARSLAEAEGGRLLVERRAPNPVVALVLAEPLQAAGDELDGRGGA
jgi:signal transduction histidine kinase